MDVQRSKIQRFKLQRFKLQRFKLLRFKLLRRPNYGWSRTQIRVNRAGFTWLGCVGVLAGIALICGLCFAGLALYLRSQFKTLTSDKRVVLPSVVVTAEQMQQIEKRIDKMSQRSSGRTLQDRELMLTPEDINALISKEPRLSQSVFVKIVDEQLKADVSIPTDFLPGGEGRFFNAEVTLQASIENDSLQLKIASVEVDGKPVAKSWIERFGANDFAKPLYNDAEISKLLENIEAVEIVDQAIRFRLRASANPEQAMRQSRYLRERQMVQR